MTSMSRTVMCGLVVALALAALAATSSRGGNAARVSLVRGGCPKGVNEHLLFLRPQPAVALVRAVHARVPRLYADLTSMGHAAWPGFTISALINLRQPPTDPLPYRITGTDPYFSIAKRACGSKAAITSVLVFLEFPNCQIPCGQSWVFATSTASGWHVWRAR